MPLGGGMKRRTFIVGLGSAALPLAAHAQEKMRRVGVLMNSRPDDPDGQVRLAALLQGMQETGWSVGRNLNIDIRAGGGDADSYAKHATEMLKLGSDVVVTSGGTTTRAMQHVSRTVPIVFVNVTDPVGGGMITSLARPGGNATG